MSNPSVLPNRLDVNLICRHIDAGLTKYTPVQIYMAMDEWQAAHDEYVAAQFAAGDIDTIVASQYHNDVLWQIAAHRFNPAYAKFDDAIRAAADKVVDYCPLLGKMRNHSNEAFPVDTTLKIAAQLRNAAKKFNKAVAVYNKANS